jgi:eukaryotic-like serine/threonine-protein kinase
VGNDETPTHELDPQRGGSASALAEPFVITAGTRLAGRYRLERRLGHGGMAVVWLATDDRLGRPVAIKVLSEVLTDDHDYIGRFRREAKLAAGLQHPNLVSIYDYDAGDRPYLVMEYVEGGDLAERLEAGSAPAAEQLAGELLSALRHIHEAGVLHRDVKPQNILVDGYGHARLTDFGIARPHGGDPLTATGEVIGTRSYIAPEVMAGEPASERSDLFALGVVLADAARDGAGAALWKLVDELRDPEPGRRPGSAEGALASLEHDSDLGQAGEPTRAFSIAEEPKSEWPVRAAFEPTATGGRSAPRRLRAVIAAALALSAAVVGIVLAAAGGDGGKPSPSGGAQSATATGSTPGNSDPSSSSGSTAADSMTSTNSTTTDSSASSAAPPAASGAASGATLNDRGFQLAGAGDYAAAVPVLERAVDALRGSGDQATYNYALYNLASAYLGAGRPADAVPLLQERMGFDDGQLGEVQKTLDRALATLGQTPTKPAKPEKPAKPDKHAVGGPPYGGPQAGEAAPPFGEAGD